MSIELEALQEAIDRAGGQTALARLIGGKVRQGHVWYWLNVSQRLPPKHAPVVAEKTGVPIGRLCTSYARVRRSRAKVSSSDRLQP